MYCYACNQATKGHATDLTRCEHCMRVLWEALAQPCSTKPMRDIPYKALCKWGAGGGAGKGGQKLLELESIQNEDRK